MKHNYQAPRGTVDIYGDELACWQQVEDVFRQFMHLYDYSEIRTPIFEDTGVFKRENDSSDMVNKEMYTFTVNHKDSLTLRPEGTAGVIRSYVQHKLFALGEGHNKFWYFGPMFRYERPQKGRQRQFYQFGVENLGEKSPYVDAEVIAMGYSILKALGLSHIKVCLNTLGDAASREAYRVTLRDYFRPYLDQMCGDCQRRYEQNVLRLLDCKIDHDQPFMKNVPSIRDVLSEESRIYFESVCATLDALDIPYEIDDRLVRGLDYYTDTVFEVISTDEASGAQSTVFGGGRYDNLVDYFGGPSQSGIGFAMGMERLMILANAEGVFSDLHTPLDCYIMTLGNTQQMGVVLSTQLRAAGYRVEMNFANRSMKSQFKSVDRFNATTVLILGEDELANNTVTLKRVADQHQVSIPMDQLVETMDEWLMDTEEHHHE